MPKPAKMVISGLQNKGFERKDGRHIQFRLHIEGKKTSVYTMVSHGEKEIHDRLLSTMARQVKLSRKQFNDLVECPLSHGDYVDLLQKKGHIEN